MALRRGPVLALKAEPVCAPMEESQVVEHEARLIIDQDLRSNLEQLDWFQLPSSSPLLGNLGVFNFGGSGSSLFDQLARTRL